jgi:hypothetical protein
MQLAHTSTCYAAATASPPSPPTSPNSWSTTHTACLIYKHCQPTPAILPAGEPCHVRTPPAARCLCCLASSTDLYPLLRISQRVLLCCLVQLSLHQPLEPLLGTLLGCSGSSSSSAGLQHRQALQQGPKPERNCRNMHAQ